MLFTHTNDLDPRQIRRYERERKRDLPEDFPVEILSRFLKLKKQKS